MRAGIIAYIVNGLESKGSKSIIDIATARFKEQQQLKAGLEKTKDKLEERKLVERAKDILIKTRDFSEDEAYHTLQKLAMDRNIALAEMAKNGIAMSELLAH
ncbi:ANTAR domain-containing response regulator [Methyloprofundus sp.]|uniref:ANTAR domain-containing response regulator n=1 Tax=Methyloprofundus sp. TaxID=2020875 RepID=UPI003D1008EB